MLDFRLVQLDICIGQFLDCPKLSKTLMDFGQSKTGFWTILDSPKIILYNLKTKLGSYFKEVNDHFFTKIIFSIFLILCHTIEVDQDITFIHLLQF